LGEAEQHDGHRQPVAFTSLLRTAGTHFGPPQEKSKANERTMWVQTSQAIQRQAP
jgi:hypothetical protein